MVLRPRLKTLCCLRPIFTTRPTLLAWAVALGAGSGLLGAFAAWTTSQAVNALIRLDRMASFSLVVAAVLVGAASAILANVGGYAATKASSSIQRSMELEAAHGLVSRPELSHLESTDRLAQVELARYAAEEGPRATVDLLVELLSVLTSTTTYVILLVSSWPWMAAALIVTTVPIVLLQVSATRSMIKASLAAVSCV